MKNLRGVVVFQVKRYLQEKGVPTVGKDKQLCYMFAQIENMTIPGHVSVFTHLETLFLDPTYKTLGLRGPYSRGRLRAQV